MYSSHREKCQLITAWNEMRAYYKFKQKEAKCKVHYKKMLFKRAFSMVRVNKAQKVYTESINEQSDLFRSMVLMKKAF